MSMSKFKETLQIIEEGLLKPMTDIEIKQVDAERLKDTLDEILSRSTKNSDESIDIEGSVDLNGLKLKKLPLKFNKVSGNFYCGNNQLTSLEGSPKEVGGFFNCSSNNLTSLEGAPKKVGGDFWCYSNAVKFTPDQVISICDVHGDIFI